MASHSEHTQSATQGRGDKKRGREREREKGGGTWREKVRRGGQEEGEGEGRRGIYVCRERGGEG